MLLSFNKTPNKYILDGVPNLLNEGETETIWKKKWSSYFCLIK